MRHDEKRDANPPPPPPLPPPIPKLHMATYFIRISDLIFSLFWKIFFNQSKSKVKILRHYFYDNNAEV